MKLIIRDCSMYRFDVSNTFHIHGYFEHFYELKLYYMNNSEIGYEIWCNDKSFYI